MKGFSDQQHESIADNKQEYGDRYNRLKWISETRASSADDERDELLTWLKRHGVQTSCHRTKLNDHSLSPGCQSCAKGEWSCLFVNGICNGRCFFCPTDQSDIGEPTTQTIQFSDPQDYADYLDQFHFKGVSISGGEPLMSLERTLRFMSAVKRRFDQGVHLWLYTNGRLVTEDALKALKDAGLDEIRFNICADKNFLKKIGMAAGLIQYVTVEIPAISEQFEVLKRTLVHLKDSGVHFLNLHQLRLTPRNYRHLIKRHYTYLHGPKVTVLESELMALKIMKYNLENAVHLPIHYCSFVYKNRYQMLSARNRHARYIMKPHEALTETGIIRSLSAKGHPKQVRQQVEILRGLPVHEGTWSLNRTGDGFFFHPSLWPQLHFEKLSLVVRYHDTAIRPFISYKNMFKEIRLNEKTKVVIERWPLCSELELHQHDIPRFGRKYLSPMGDVKKVSPRNGIDIRRNRQVPPWGEMDRFEFLQKGLAAYY